MSPEALFAAIAARGARTVLRGDDCALGGTEVIAQVRRRAELLRRHGCRRVALALDNGPDWVLWDLALLSEGLVCVPLAGFFSPTQLRHALDSAGVDSIVAEDPLRWREAGFAQVGTRLARRVPRTLPVLPTGTVKITYTSGTTGQPRGVCLDAAAMFAVADSLRRVTPDDAARRHLCVLPLAVLLENIAGVYAPLLAGAEVVLPSLAGLGLGMAAGQHAGAWLDGLVRLRPSSLILIPHLLRALVEAGEGGFALPDTLRFVAVGGGHVAPALLERAEALGLPVCEGYGLSECASVVCLNTRPACRIGTVGRPLPHCEVRIADDGEVWVRGSSMLGYVGEPAPSEEWLATGDLGRLEDGYLVLLGRRKHQFVTAWGRNVNPEWVEAELAAHPLIAQAWLYGEAMPDNVAVIVPRQADSGDAELTAAVQSVNRKLPDYMRAHRWLRADKAFSSANGLATANGRLRRDALAACYLPRFGAGSEQALHGETA